MRRIFWLAAAGGVLCTALWAQAPRMPESLSAWRFFKEIPVTAVSPALLDFVLDREMLDAARPDDADIRLYDSAGREIPYVLRVRREVERHAPFEAREFNRGSSEGAVQASYDLGEAPQEHNEVEIQTAGTNFRRLADVEGSSDDAHWSTLVTGAILFRFGAGGRTVEQQSVSYPVSRYRYLLIRVNRDPQVDHSAPELVSVRIRRSVHQTGEMISFPGTLAGREADRDNGRPASVWRVDLGGRIPLERAVLSVSGGAFSRPFRLDGVDDPASPNMIASGDLVHRDDQGQELAIDFPERFARRLKLTVTDDRNVPLAIFRFTAQSAAREVIFEAKAAGTGALRVYYGNPKAAAPHYDLAAQLPAELDPPPARLSPGEQSENPIYTPEPKPFSERSPWLVYVVLGLATVVLAAILVSLVRWKVPVAEP
ncbi:MAG TPA: DUF3999 family protein [Bryobacteraceae bacterium]|nr:DUF3999 family protein [Bryobacteraceae bacterium]